MEVLSANTRGCSYFGVWLVIFIFSDRGHLITISLGITSLNELQITPVFADSRLLKADSYQQIIYPMRDFQQLSIWQRSHLITLKIYTVTKSFPKEELFGLTSQMRRSSSSIPTNIAEGCGRDTIPELKRFLTIAAGSASELHYQIILSKDLNYLSVPLFQELVSEIIQIKKMIYTYSEKLV